MRILWNSFEMGIHTPSYTAARSDCCHSSPCPKSFPSMIPPSQEKFKGNCLMAQKKVKEMERV